MPKVSILANCLVKGQWAFENETHGGCSLDVLGAASAYKSSRGPSQCLPPQGILCEVHLWRVVKDEDNAVKAVIFLGIDCKDQSRDTINLSGD